MFRNTGTYIGSVVATFGAWLLGYFLLVTQGIPLKVFHPLSSALFCFVADPSGHHVDHTGNKVGDNSVEMGIHFFFF